MESLLGTGDVHGDYCSILPGEWQGKHRAEAAPESTGKRAGASIRQREQGNGELALALPSQGIAHQGSGTAAGVAQPGDQILRLFHSQPVGPLDGEPPGYLFQSCRVPEPIKSPGQDHSPFCRVIGAQQGEGQAGIFGFAAVQGMGSQPVESAVLPHHKLCYALFPDMTLDLGGQRWQDIAGGVPVPNEKTAAVWHKQSLFLLYFIVKIIR